MPMVKLIADSGATKAEWCLLREGKKKTIFTQGISPYFLNTEQITDLLLKELKPKLKNIEVDEIFYYGTGCANPVNAKSVKKALQKVFPESKVDVNHDLMAAARALCGNNKGVACILGTGSNSCYFDGKKIVKNSPGLGYVLGDEGSGAYLGKKVIQYYLYGTFDDELRGRFDLTYTTNTAEILESVYKKPLPNRYLAGFTKFLAENRGHYMIENIIEDGLNDFFFNHLCKYRETWTLPVHFAGSVAFGFKDVLQQLCNSYEFELGKVMKNPMEGLVTYHR
ncbi:MAG: N-acetylglucosamine kinase [Chitinophagaceae bacterium]|jgi:N-acetylglucosamine kinase-like BadF-type ATPase|nr:N-acetylglucosamine kinase [Chitinophagaceae bacterium]MBK8299194.1 N-acetylglucosamine kinase [Chitinophagaceae bacterium]MBK9936837.1 N-acetylglucosamine kinase [Chitinophagaceae bacterium]MBL0068600.1 N-acetylglucosamine kinase [Chitinophagaceae bacterium]MBP6233652.1 N-acetylglucosamine kinase [Chitinophagaceae bacterium]